MSRGVYRIEAVGDWVRVTAIGQNGRIEGELHLPRRNFRLVMAQQMYAWLDEHWDPLSEGADVLPLRSMLVLIAPTLTALAPLLPLE